MDKDHLPETWFCFVCAAKQDTLAKRSGRLFAVMLFNLEKKNPVAFNLPVRIREYFEGVKTGEEGEYQDALVHKTRTRVGYDEAPDHLKLRDGKGELIVCFACRKSALDHRPIITCDYCNLHWHLDCLDPPMANPPLRNTIHGKKRHWMCPNHTEHELLNNGKAWDMGTSAHPKIRRPKRAKIVEPAVGRGFRNNGIIEIENDVSDGDYNFVDEEHFGTIYRLPEKGIKLDFIDSVKQKNARARDAAIKAAKDEQARSQTSGRSAKKLKTKSGDVTTALGGRSSADQEAALSLAQFAGANHDLGLSSSRVEGLIQTLISEAPTDMDLTTTGTTDDRSASVGGNDPLSPPASDPARGEGSPSLSEREHLMKLAELIRRRLGTST
ncbi:MAG: hypothetical protein M1817_001252 [Caeruleum heppii]|nr:MAG: hypothetical protein M1817_001252 [Caeruleum heppii]